MSIFGKDEEETMENRKIQENDVDALIALLDGRTQAGDSRIKLDIVEGQGEDTTPAGTPSPEELCWPCIPPGISSTGKGRQM